MFIKKVTYNIKLVRRSSTVRQSCGIITKYTIEWSLIGNNVTIEQENQPENVIHATILVNIYLI